MDLDLKNSISIDRYLMADSANPVSVPCDPTNLYSRGEFQKIDRFDCELAVTESIAGQSF